MLSDRADASARKALESIYPKITPWAEAALWHGRAPAGPVPTAPLEDELDLIRGQRLSGLLLRYVQDTGITLAAEHRRELQSAVFHWMAVTASVSEHAVAGIDLLEAAGIRAVVPKGPGIARLYPTTHCRPFSDIDLLVEPREFDPATRLLESAGWTEDAKNLQPWNYFRRYCREGLNLHHASGGSVDLHHRPPPWIWSGGMNVATMRARAVTVESANQTFRCLSPADNALIAALHIVSDRNEPGRSLLVWRDIVESVRACPIDELVATADAVGLAGWLRAVLIALPREVTVADVVDALPVAPLPHPRRLATLLSDRGTRYGVLSSQCLRLPIPNAVAFAAGMAMPPPRWLREKFPNDSHPYRTWWGRAATKLG